MADSLGARIGDFLDQERRLHEKQLKINSLSAEVDKLRLQNDKMREGMRRCVTCDYRLAVINQEPCLSSLIVGAVGWFKSTVRRLNGMVNWFSLQRVTSVD